MTKHEEYKQLNVYLKSFGNIESLDKEKELNLVANAKNGDSEAMRKLVAANIKFIASVATKHTNCGVPLLDLMQEGVIFFVKAINKFDVSTKNTVRSYAQIWVQKGITDCIANVGRTVRLPMNKEYERYLAKKNGEEVDNISDVSLDKKVSDDSNTVMGDLMAKVDPAVVTKHDQERIADVVNVKLSKLKERDKEIVKAYFGIGRDYALPSTRVAEEFDISNIRVTQIVKGALEQMKA